MPTKRLALALCALTACQSEEGDVEVRVFAAASLKAALTALEPTFERAHPGVDVRVHAAGSQLLVTQLQEGARADLFVSADEAQMKRAQSAGLVTAPVVLAKNRLVLVVAQGSEGRIQALEDVTKEGVRLVLAGEAVPAGAYTRALLGARGLLEGALLHTVSFEENVTGVLMKVALGEADAGIVYATDARAAKDQVRTIKLGPEGQPQVRYYLAKTTAGEASPTAHALLEALLGEDGQGALAHHGFERR